MANNKTGFNYYPLDTDRYQDRRIKRLKKDFGCSGIAVYDFLICEVYRVEGCYMVWDENTLFDVSEYFSIKESLVSEIVKYCAVVGLFDQTLLCRGIITSQSIQSRYIEMSKKAKRSNIKIPPELLLLDDKPILPEKNEILPEEKKKVQEEIPQSKVKEIKENPPSVPPMGKGGQYFSLERETSNTPTHNMSALIRRLEKLRIGSEEINKILAASDNGLIGHPVWSVLIKTENAKNLHSPGRFILSELNRIQENKK